MNALTTLSNQISIASVEFMNLSMEELGTKLSSKNTERQRQTDHLAKLKKFIQHPSPYILMSKSKLDEILASRGLLNVENRSKKMDEKRSF